MNVLQGRQVTPQEVKLMLVLATHDGAEPLRLEQIERRMVPHSLCEEKLLENGLVERRADRVGRPIPGSLQLSARGRGELSYWLNRSIGECDTIAAKALNDEHRKLTLDLKAWLSRHVGRFPHGGQVPEFTPIKAEPMAPVSSTGRKRNLPPKPSGGKRTSAIVQEPANDDAIDPDDGQEGERGDLVPPPAIIQEPVKRGPGRPRNPRPIA